MQAATLYSGDGLTSLQINGGSNGFYVFSPVEGLESASVRTVVQPRPGAHGAYIPGALYGERRFNLKGSIEGDSTTHWSRRRSLEEVIRIQRDAYGIPRLPTLKWTTDDALSLQLEFELASALKMAEGLPSVSYWELDCVSDHVIVSQSSVSTNFSVDAGLGAVLPWVLPITLGTSSASNKTLTNSGNGLAYPTITFTGPLTNPGFYDQTIDRRIALTYTVPSGSSVVIDMLERTVVENLTINRIDKVTSASSWWALDPGANNCFFSTSNSADTGSCTVVYRHSYGGI